MVKWKMVVFSLLPLLALLLLGEITARLIYFQIKGDTTFALSKALQKISHEIILYKFESFKKNRTYDFAHASALLFSDKGHSLLEEFQKKYEHHFKEIVSTVKKSGMKLVVLYLPSGEDVPKSDNDNNRTFFKSLAYRYNIDFLDLTSILRKYEMEDIFLFPENEHLSRHGNRIIARELNKYLTNFKHFRSPQEMASDISEFGDLKPSRENIWDISFSMPYRVITNKQGFRNINDISAIKNRQRVLILGDSYTFGPYLPNHDTYPAQLEKINSDLEAINAGIAGYTITDEASLFVNQAYLTAPDIVVLQVVDNDIPGLFYFLRNNFNRGRKTYLPTPLEQVFLQQLAKDDQFEESTSPSTN